MENLCSKMVSHFLLLLKLFLFLITQLLDLRENWGKKDVSVELLCDFDFEDNQNILILDFTACSLLFLCFSPDPIQPHEISLERTEC